MSNCCVNRLTVTAPRAAMLRPLLDKLLEGRNVNLGAIIPEPREPGGQEDQERINWRRANWGTKAAGVAHVAWPMDSRVEVTFDTASNPPRQVVEALAAQHPELELELLYAEPANGFAGRRAYAGGKCTDDIESYAPMDTYAEICEDVLGYNPDEDE